MVARHLLHLAPLKVIMNPRGITKTGMIVDNKVEAGEVVIATPGAGVEVAVEEEAQEERVDHTDLQIQAGLGGRRMRTSRMVPMVPMIRMARTVRIGSGNDAFRCFPLSRLSLLLSFTFFEFTSVRVRSERLFYCFFNDKFRCYFCLILHVCDPHVRE